MMYNRRVFVTVALVALCLVGSAQALVIPPGGEYAIPRWVPYQDPPPAYAGVRLRCPTCGDCNGDSTA